jgi:hypothetical protein
MHSYEENHIADVTLSAILHVGRKNGFCRDDDCMSVRPSVRDLVSASKPDVFDAEF